MVDDVSLIPASLSWCSCRVPLANVITRTQARTIFESLDLAWSLLRSFPKELLKKITKAQLERWYSRRAAAKQEEERA